MSNPLKAIVKGAKKVFKATTKIVKKVVKSPIFKVAVIAAAGYFAGAAAGLWSTPWSSAAAASGGTAATGTNALATGVMESGLGIGSAGVPAHMGAAGGGIVGSTTAAGTQAAGSGLLGGLSRAGNTIMEKASNFIGTSPTSTNPALGGLAKAGGAAGDVAASGSGLLGFAGNNPLVTATGLQVGGNMLTGYMQGRALDEEQKRQKAERNAQTIYGVRYDAKDQSGAINTGSKLQDMNAQLFSGVYANRLTPLYQQGL